MLTIFYDGNCPLCSMEMKHLRRLDKENRIVLQDLNQRGFSSKFSDIDRDQAMKVLHGKLNGVTIRGLDVTYHAWRLVGKSRWVAFLRWPVIRPMADIGYTFFAKHRQTISRLLMGKQHCKNGECQINR